MATPSLYIAPDMLKAGKLYSQLPPSGAGDFTVVRNTTATRVNASGLLESVAANVPRIDYRGGGCGSLLVEPAATNLLLRSEEFDNAYWTKNNSTIGANVAVAPDGASTADKIIANNATGINANIARQNIIFSSSSAITFSIFVKQDGFTWSRIRLFDRRNNVGYNQFVNLAAGTLGAIPAGLTASIQSFGNGWYKVNLSLPSVAGSPEIDVFVGSASSDGVAEVNGNGVLGMLAWGAQLEVGSVATSYIPTVAATVTRNADVINRSAASGLIGQTEGTIYAEVNLRTISNQGKILAISNNTTAEAIFIQRRSDNAIQVRSRVAGINQYEFISSAISAGVFKIAVGYNANDYVTAINGVIVDSSTASASVPACNTIDLGKAEGSLSTFLNDRITTAALYPTRLTNATLAQLTTL